MPICAAMPAIWPLWGDGSCSFTALSRKLGWSEKRVEKDLGKMIDRGYFGDEAYLDQSLGYFFRSRQADAELKNSERPSLPLRSRPRRQRRAIPAFCGISAGPTTGSPIRR